MGICTLLIGLDPQAITDISAWRSPNAIAVNLPLLLNRSTQDHAPGRIQSTQEAIAAKTHRRQSRLREGNFVGSEIHDRCGPDFSEVGGLNLEKKIVDWVRTQDGL